ncbi:hypothetical protein ACQP2Y_12335 [Actinoplanes sp. CA-051413]|uniref:hypothetical protein n=1 Tax=Actinoplanes sp. CA-051413 TaxID=3239899 RepID=UPI003D97D186
MTGEPDRLYRLLPRIYQVRDEERGGPLRALLAVVTEQADLVEADIAQLYDDWFIETCQDWVVPYLAELVGYRLLHGSGEALAAGTDQARLLLAQSAPRRDVANTVGNRRRKGALALLEQLAADVAGWPARAVEFRRLLGVTQTIRLYGGDPRADARRRRRGRLADVRSVDALDRLDGPFDTLAHTVEVARISAARPGRYNIPEVGLYLWRLKPYRISSAPAFCIDRDRANFTFSILSNDTPLVARPVEEPSPTHVADETNVPAFIRRRAFTDRMAHYYGPGKSLCIWLDGDQPVPLARIVSADLSDWRYTVGRGQVAVDPVLGRISFPNRAAPETGVWVTYHHGFSADIGGGEYPRPVAAADPGDPVPLRVGPGQTYQRIMDAVRHWRDNRAQESADRDAAVIEIVGSDAYQEQIEIRMDLGDRLTIRAAEGSRPVLRLLDWYSNRPDALRVTGTGQGSGPAPRITLDGLLVTGRSIQVQGPVAGVVIRHCTLVPGWSLDLGCRPEHAEEPSLEFFDTPACVQVEHSILGTILVNAGDEQAEPNRIYLSDSILDGAGVDAFTGPDDRHAYAVFNARRCTVFGAVRSHGAGLVENCILGGPVRIARRQSGCVRFCWLQPGSRTPPRFHCEPELSGEPERVLPRYTSTRYGTPGYAQLDLACAPEIRRGAEDGSELGAFHDLFQPQREDNLRLRLAEYTPAGSDAGLIFVT